VSSGCSLGRNALASRIAQWRALAARATSAERAGGAVRLVLPAGPGTVADVAALCAAETECCAGTRFVLEVTARDVVLTAAAPDTPDLLDVLFPADAADIR
jgi:hypothetical protein